MYKNYTQEQITGLVGKLIEKEDFVEATSVVGYLPSFNVLHYVQLLYLQHPPGTLPAGDRVITATVLQTRTSPVTSVRTHDLSGYILV